MKVVETCLWISGALLIAVFFLGQSRGEAARQESISAFVEQKQRLPVAVRSPQVPVPSATQRVHPVSLRVPPAAAPDAANAHLPAPDTAAIALLRIPRIAMVVPVGSGTGDSVLLRGAGLVEGAAAPGSVGNVAIAAHRDTFFRGLKDLVIGDLIELETLDRTDTYRVSTLSVVEPTDVYVLAETGEAVLTLVTCYPFYFVGNAPQRFIVRAIATDDPSQPPRR